MKICSSNCLNFVLVKKVSRFSQTYEAAQQFSSMDNNQKCFLSSRSDHIRGSCDAEDWSNDAGNSALITEINDIYSIFTQKSVN